MSTFDRDVALMAGVKAKHLVRLLDISRYTAYNWLSGRRRPHDLLQDRVSVFMDALQGAVADGDLPVKNDEDMLSEERSFYLLQNLQERMNRINGS